MKKFYLILALLTGMISSAWATTVTTVKTTADDATTAYYYTFVNKGANSSNCLGLLNGAFDADASSTTQFYFQSTGTDGYYYIRSKVNPSNYLYCDGNTCGTTSGSNSKVSLTAYDSSNYTKFMWKVASSDKYVSLQPYNQPAVATSPAGVNCNTYNELWAAGSTNGRSWWTMDETSETVKAKHNVTYVYKFDGTTVYTSDPTAVEEGATIPAPADCPTWGYLNSSYTHEGETMGSDDVEVEVTLTRALVVNMATGAITSTTITGGKEFTWTSTESDPLQVTLAGKHAYDDGMKSDNGIMISAQRKDSKDFGDNWTIALTGDYNITGYDITFKAYESGSQNNVLLNGTTATANYQTITVSNVNASSSAFTVSSTSGVNYKLLISKIVVRYAENTPVPTTVTANMYVDKNFGYATFCAPFDVPVPDEVKAYKATSIEGDWLKMEEVENGTITAGTPVVLTYKGEKDFNQDFTDVPTADESTGTCLIGNLTGAVKDVAKDNYLLQKQDTYGTGWYRVAEDNTLTIGPNRCYLTKTANAREFYGMSFDGETTGIQSVAAQAATKADGKYLVNGQVVVVKSGKAYNVNGVQY